MHNVINDLCTGCELCIEPCPVDCIELVDIYEEQALLARSHSEYFFDLKAELDHRKKKKAKMNKNISKNVDLAGLINQKLENRNLDKGLALKKLQLTMLDSHKTEKHISSADLE